MSEGPVVICDPGVDDFLALLVLAGAGSSPSSVIGTGGNVAAELAYRNAVGTMALLGLSTLGISSPRSSGWEEPLPAAAT
jgi:inosine-uridine nucleoside N-ribohydrolase